MKIFKFISVIIALMFFESTANAQKNNPAASKSGSMEMPADTKTQAIPNDEKFKSMITKINETVVFRYDQSYKNADAFIMKNGKETLM
jgi:hypothetical protein